MFISISRRHNAKLTPEGISPNEGMWCLGQGCLRLCGGVVPTAREEIGRLGEPIHYILYALYVLRYNCDTVTVVGQREGLEDWGSLTDR